MSKVYISWNNFHDDCQVAAEKAKSHLPKIDCIISLARGGLVPGRIIAEYLKPKTFLVMGINLYTGDCRGDEISVYQDIPTNIKWDESNNILVVDDISDGGTTLRFAVDRLSKQVKGTIFTATPYIKPHTSFKPDIYTKEYGNDIWIVFPFEAD